MKYKGTDYEFCTDERNYYDYFIYKDEVYDTKPSKTIVYGYIRKDGDIYGFCKRDIGRLALTLSISGVVCVISICVILVNSVKINVPHIDMTRNRDDVIGKLDDGIVKVSKKASYSQYVTYDGKTVGVYLDDSIGDTIQLIFGDDKSDNVPVSTAYAIPMHISMEPQDVLDGTMLVTKGDKVTTYPITVEYLQSDSPTLSVGEDIQGTTPAYSDNISQDINAYEATDNDFENFDVLSDDPGPDW